MQRHKYKIENPSHELDFSCYDGETVLEGALRGKGGTLRSGCASGGCGICRIAVLGGQWQRCGVMSRAHVSEADEIAGVVLACRIRPQSDLLIQEAAHRPKANIFWKKVQS